MIRKFRSPFSVSLTTRRRGTPFLLPNQLTVSNLASNSHPEPAQTTTKPILLAFFFAPLPLLGAFLRTPTPLNLHKFLGTDLFRRHIHYRSQRRALTGQVRADRSCWRGSLCPGL